MIKIHLPNDLEWKKMFWECRNFCFSFKLVRNWRYFRVHIFNFWLPKWDGEIWSSSIRMPLEFISNRIMCSIIWNKKMFWECKNCCFSFELVRNWRYFQVHIFNFCCQSEMESSVAHLFECPWNSHQIESCAQWFGIKKYFKYADFAVLVLNL